MQPRSSKPYKDIIKSKVAILLHYIFLYANLAEKVLLTI